MKKQQLRLQIARTLDLISAPSHIPYYVRNSLVILIAPSFLL